MTQSITDKISADYYLTKIPYPIKKHFEVYWVYSKGTVIANGPVDNFDDAAVNGWKKNGYVIERVTENIAFNAEKNAYNTDQQRLNREFHADLADDFGLTNHPKEQKLFDLVWDSKRSDGFDAVYHEYSRMSDLLT